MSNASSIILAGANLPARPHYDRESGQISIPTLIEGVELTFSPLQSELNEKQMLLLGPIGIDPGWPPMQVAAFLMECLTKGFDPWSREAYLMNYKGKFVHHIGIAGFRKHAEATGEYIGRDQVVYYDNHGKEYRIWLSDDVPAAAEVTVHRTGKRPWPTVVLYDEYAPLMNEWAWDPATRQEQPTGNRVPVPMWRPGKQGGKVTSMMAKVGEAAGLRGLFPNRFGNWYVPEELHVAAAEADVPLIEDNQTARRREAYRIATTGRAAGDVDAEEIGAVVVDQADTDTDDGELLTEDQVRVLLLAERAAQAAIIGRTPDWMAIRWAKARTTEDHPVAPSDFPAAPVSEIAGHVRKFRTYVADELRKQGRHEMADRYAHAPHLGTVEVLFGGDPAAPVVDGETAAVA